MASKGTWQKHASRLFPEKCNLCGETNHLFRDCPKSFANKLKAAKQTERGKTEAFREQCEEAGLEISNLPPNSVVGGEGSGEAGEGEGPATPPSRDGEMQAEGGAGIENQLQDNSEDASLPNAQQTKRPLSELSFDSPIMMKKRGRLAASSDNSSLDEPRVFPSSSPNEVSFLTIALRSTPRGSDLDATMQQRLEPKAQRGNRAQNLHSSPVEMRAEFCSQETA